MRSTLPRVTCCRRLDMLIIGSTPMRVWGMGAPSSASTADLADPRPPAPAFHPLICNNEGKPAPLLRFGIQTPPSAVRRSSLSISICSRSLALSWRRSAVSASVVRGCESFDSVFSDPLSNTCHFPKSASVTFQSRLQQRYFQEMRESKITLRQRANHLSRALRLAPGRLGNERHVRPR